MLSHAYYIILVKCLSNGDPNKHSMTDCRRTRVHKVGEIPPLTLELGVEPLQNAKMPYTAPPAVKPGDHPFVLV